MDGSNTVSAWSPGVSAHWEMVCQFQYIQPLLVVACLLQAPLRRMRPSKIQTSDYKPQSVLTTRFALPDIHYSRTTGSGMTCGCRAITCCEVDDRRPDIILNLSSSSTQGCLPCFSKLRVTKSNIVREGLLLAQLQPSRGSDADPSRKRTGEGM